MKRIIQEGKEILSTGFIQKLRKDFLTLLKNLKRVKNYSQALELQVAVNKWRTMYEKYLADLRQDLEGQERIFRHKGQDGSADWAKHLASKGMKKLWELNHALSDSLVWRMDAYHTKDQRFYQYEKDVKKWEGRARRASREAWKALDEIEKWSKRGGLFGGEEITLTRYEKKNVAMEGFKVQLYGFDGSPGMADEMGSMQRGLAFYRKRAARVFPWLLKHALPIQVRFADAPGGAGIWTAASYANDHIEMHPMGLTEKGVKRFAHVFAHEMGHHIWRTYLSTDMQDAWRKFIRGDYDRIDLDDLKRKIGSGTVVGYAEKIERSDPVLSVQLMTLFDDPRMKDYDLWDAESIDRYIDKTGDTELMITAKPVTGYGAKNPEEAFCEAIGLLVGYGPRAVLPEVRHFVQALVPGIKLESEDHEGMRSLLERLERR